MSAFRRFLVLVPLCLPAAAGCDVEHHGAAEHVVPEHRPSDIFDASEKIQMRAIRLTSTPPPAGEEAQRLENELRDIVGWTPEIAADTDLTEEQWLPIYRAAEQLSLQLRNVSRPPDQETINRIASFKELLVRQGELLLAESDEPEPSGEIDSPDRGPDAEEPAETDIPETAVDDAGPTSEETAR